MSDTWKAMSDTWNAMAYGAKLMDHYENPRNAGSWDKADPRVGTGMVGSPASGDVIKFQIRVDARGSIEEARFKTYGCGAAIACSSLATEWVKGKSLDDAAAIRGARIAEELALPSVKIHCSILTEEAIQAAIADYRARHGPGRTLGAQTVAA
jgi:nitrogen fixation NifU-like protein